MARPRKVPEGAPDPVPGCNGAALERIVAFFKAKHPDEWAGIERCPLAYGLGHMAEVMKARP